MVSLVAAGYAIQLDKRTHGYALEVAGPPPARRVALFSGGCNTNSGAATVYTLGFP